MTEFELTAAVINGISSRTTVAPHPDLVESIVGSILRGEDSVRPEEPVDGREYRQALAAMLGKLTLPHKDVAFLISDINFWPAFMKLAKTVEEFDWIRVDWSKIPEGKNIVATMWQGFGPNDFNVFSRIERPAPKTRPMRPDEVIEAILARTPTGLIPPERLRGILEFVPPAILVEELEKSGIKAEAPL